MNKQLNKKQIAIYKTNVPSISNNNYILKSGDLVKIIKEIQYSSGRIIKENEMYFIKDCWNTTNGNIALHSNNENECDFSLSPCTVNKILNYKQ
tara:strand:- start:37 stop:318 length:282 start_codon:yes stop_codon:yes gene_type:complete